MNDMEGGGALQKRQDSLTRSTVERQLELLERRALIHKRFVG